MATKINSDITLNKRRSFLLNAIAFTVSVFSIGSFMQRQLGKITPDKSTDDSDQLTMNIIQPSIHPLAVPRSKRSSN
jgi:hypothetical protein